MFAVMTLLGLEHRHQLRPGSPRFLVQPGPAVLQRHAMFGPAGHHASLAIDALLRVDHHRIAFGVRPHECTYTFLTLTKVSWSAALPETLSHAVSSNSASDPPFSA